MVELGYSVAPEHQRRGYATEIVTLLVAHARADARVRTLQAHTTAANVASVRVLERTGFGRASHGDDPDAPVRYEYRGSAA
jgi:RimJ/RimL family protein N-acetyltransferase